MQTDAFLFQQILFATKYRFKKDESARTIESQPALQRLKVHMGYDFVMDADFLLLQFFEMKDISCVL